MSRRARKYPSETLEPVKGHPQFYLFEMTHDPTDWWISGAVRARSPEKARRKARRIQVQTGWRHMRIQPLPSKRISVPEFPR